MLKSQKLGTAEPQPIFTGSYKKKKKSVIPCASNVSSEKHLSSEARAKTGRNLGNKLRKSVLELF